MGVGGGYVCMCVCVGGHSEGGRQGIHVHISSQGHCVSARVRARGLAEVYFDCVLFFALQWAICPILER